MSPVRTLLSHVTTDILVVGGGGGAGAQKLGLPERTSRVPCVLSMVGEQERKEEDGTAELTERRRARFSSR